jgi:hypothetical protein
MTPTMINSNQSDMRVLPDPREPTPGEGAAP